MPPAVAPPPGALPRRVHRLLTELAETRERMARARRQLARATKGTGALHCVEESWQWAHELMEQRRERLLGHQGVVGYGLATRIRAGEHLATPCVAVYVERKRAAHELPRGGALQRAIHSHGRRLPVDVVELGRIERQVAPGDVIGPEPDSERASLGVFARDFAAGDVVAITAMHASPLRELIPPATATIPFQSPVPGVPFGSLRAGSMTGIDAAKLALASPPAAPISVLPTIGQVRGWRPTTYPGDQGAPVRIFGATSQLLTGTIVNPAAALPSESLDAAILVDMPTQAGDSGSALVDSENLLLGFLVGRGQLAVFTPASLVLARLGCDVPAS